MQATVVYDNRAARRAGLFALAVAALLAVLVCVMVAAHQHSLAVPVVPQTTVQTDVCPIGDDWSCALR